MIHLKDVDPALYDAVCREEERQESTLELIASENFVPAAVREATGTVLTNKYAEGYPGRRYYGGCECVDIAEELARERVKALFGAEHANVQPHAGSQANMAVYYAVLESGDTILGMDLAHGGHLTHGSPVNFSGRFFKIVGYGVDADSGRIDYDQVRNLAREHRPKLIVAGASAYPRRIDFAAFRQIADEVNALLMVDMAHIAGLIAADLHPNPVPYADFVTSTTHKTLRGPRGGFILCCEKYAQAVDKMVMPGIQGGPLMHVIAAKAVCFHLAAQDTFREYQRSVVDNAQAMAAELTNRGFQLVSGGTDNHLMLVDLESKQVTGKEAEQALERVGITVNKNMVPFDSRPPMVTSGIRVGTPAVTTRGMGAEEMTTIAELIDHGIRYRNDREQQEALHQRVLDLCARFPLSSELVPA